MFSDQFVELIVRGRHLRDRRWAQVGPLCGRSAGGQYEMGWMESRSEQQGWSCVPTPPSLLEPEPLNLPGVKHKPCRSGLGMRKLRANYFVLPFSSFLSRPSPNAGLWGLRPCGNGAALGRVPLGRRSWSWCIWFLCACLCMSKRTDPYLSPGSGQGFRLSPNLPETEARSQLCLFWHWAPLARCSRGCAGSVGLTCSFLISYFFSPPQMTRQGLGWAPTSNRTPLKS